MGQAAQAIIIFYVYYCLIAMFLFSRDHIVIAYFLYCIESKFDKSISQIFNLYLLFDWNVGLILNSSY